MQQWSAYKSGSSEDASAAQSMTGGKGYGWEPWGTPKKSQASLQQFVHSTHSSNDLGGGMWRIASEGLIMYLRQNIWRVRRMMTKCAGTFGSFIVQAKKMSKLGDCSHNNHYTAFARLWKMGMESVKIADLNLWTEHTEVCMVWIHCKELATHTKSQFL